MSLDTLPRTLSRAQSMDALELAGEHRRLQGGARRRRGLRPLLPASHDGGGDRPAGRGARPRRRGRRAPGDRHDCHRLGAIVRGYDVRPEAKEQVESLGGRFVELKSVAEAVGEGGYARALTAEETKAQQEELNGHIAQHNVVITTAQVPGRRPPLLVTAEAVPAMRAGSVIVDMAASSLGGNVEGSRPEETVVTDNGVTIIGAGSLRLDDGGLRRRRRTRTTSAHSSPISSRTGRWRSTSPTRSRPVWSSPTEERWSTPLRRNWWGRAASKPLVNGA